MRHHQFAIVITNKYLLLLLYASLLLLCDVSASVVCWRFNTCKLFYISFFFFDQRLLFYISVLINLSSLKYKNGDDVTWIAIHLLSPLCSLSIWLELEKIWFFATNMYHTIVSVEGNKRYWVGEIMHIGKKYIS